MNEEIAENSAPETDHGMPDVELLNDERNRMLYEALGSINPEYRQVLHLTYFEDMTNDEVARVMKKSKNYRCGTVYPPEGAYKERTWLNFLEGEKGDAGQAALTSVPIMSVPDNQIGVVITLSPEVQLYISSDGWTLLYNGSPLLCYGNDQDFVDYLDGFINPAVNQNN